MLTTLFTGCSTTLFTGWSTTLFTGATQHCSRLLTTCNRLCVFTRVHGIYNDLSIPCTHILYESKGYVQESDWITVVRLLQILIPSVFYFKGTKTRTAQCECHAWRGTGHKVSRNKVFHGRSRVMRCEDFSVCLQLMEARKCRLTNFVKYCIKTCRWPGSVKLKIFPVGCILRAQFQEYSFAFDISVNQMIGEGEEWMGCSGRKPSLSWKRRHFLRTPC